MRILVFCIFLAGCANYPAELVGKPIDKAISLYGEPVAAVDFEGARAFFFEIDNITGKPVKKPEQSPEMAEKTEAKLKEFLNPDMPIPITNYRAKNCIYTFNTLWTGAYKEWKIHSYDMAPICGGNN